MTPRRTVLLGLAALAALASPAAATPAFQPLFNGRSLDGWTPVGGANWAVRDGVVSADNGAVGFLVSEGRYRDFDLRVEIWASPEANSGVFIRCSDPARIDADNAYEVNVYDTRPDPTYGTGAIVGLAKVDPMPKAGGRWNLIEITARGDLFRVVFNGIRTVEAARDGRFAQGPIALQYGIGVVRFRKVEIRPAWITRLSVQPGRSAPAYTPVVGPMP